MEKITLNVEGMSCSHCESIIKKAVEAIEGVSNVAVDLKGNTVTVKYDAPQTIISQIKAEIEDQGYDVV